MTVGVVKHTVGVIPYDELKKDALEMTSWFETTTTGTECYGVISGNFDGAGNSWGIIQYNWKTGTIQPILKDLINQHPDVVKTAFSNPADYDFFYNVVFNYSTTQQIAFGDSITDWANDSSGHKVKEPWKTYFHDLGVTPEAQARQLSAAQWYYDQAELWKPKLKVWSRRGYGLLFDIAVQKGNFPQGCIDQCLADYDALNVQGMTREQIEEEHLKIIANRRTDYGDVNAVAINSFRQRKLAVAQGGGTVYGSYWSPDWYDMVLEPAYTTDVDTSTTGTGGTSGKPLVMVGATALNDIKRGIDQVSKAMLGALMMWNKPTPQSFRYLKIQANSKNFDWNPTEIEILDANGVSLIPATGTVVTCSTTTFDGILANLINGDKATGAVYFDQYETNQQNTIQIDLGVVVTGVSTIKINFAYGTYSGGAIISTDGAVWDEAVLTDGEGSTIHTYIPSTGQATDLVPSGDTTAPTTTCTPQGGKYVNPITVTLTADDAGSTIFYTTDGTTPDTSSTKYTAPFTVSATCQVRYFAIDQYGNKEAVKTMWYTVGYRFVRETCMGNSFNNINTITEMKLINNSGVNVLKGKIIREAITPTNGTLAQMTDEVLGTTADFYTVLGTGTQTWSWDLGQVMTDLDYIQVWHYYGGDRYYKYKLEVSNDGTAWKTIYDYANNGTLHETASGNRHDLW